MTKLIVALDTHDAGVARSWVQKAGERVNFYKVGLELFSSAGPDFVRWLKNEGKHVFLDLKFHDIPNTASRAVAAARRLEVDLCTVHAAGGADMLRACQAEAGSVKLLAVTVLTSLTEERLQQVGVNRSLPVQVAELAQLAHSQGIAGVICAPPDLAQLQALPAEFLRVTPGIRPAGSDSGDQKRIMTPAQAVRAGASHIVVGRPITAAPDPVAAAEQILAELEAV
ncbi:MAG: orotidine-5'-phosphate decarboxylase [Firmicutes bacterium]|nr:orotidine-5'-phosphate decarboxylase [Bacillota bacterium]